MLGTYSQSLPSDTISCIGSFAVIVTFTLPSVVSSGEYNIDSIIGFVSSNSTFMLLLVANWCAVELDLVNIVKSLSLLNVVSPIDITLSGIIILFNFKHEPKAVLYIEVVLPGIIISVKLVHASKAPSCIVVTFLEIVTSVNPVHPKKVHIFITLTPLGMVTLVNDLAWQKAQFPISVTPSGIVISVKPDSWKASSDIIPTLSGIVTFFKLIQPLNALLPITLTPSGILNVSSFFPSG